MHEAWYVVQVQRPDHLGWTDLVEFDHDANGRDRAMAHREREQTTDPGREFRVVLRIESVVQ